MFGGLALWGCPAYAWWAAAAAAPTGGDADHGCDIDGSAGKLAVVNFLSLGVVDAGCIRKLDTYCIKMNMNYAVHVIVSFITLKSSEVIRTYGVDASLNTALSQFRILRLSVVNTYNWLGHGFFRFLIGSEPWCSQVPALWFSDCLGNAAAAAPTAVPSCPGLCSFSDIDVFEGHEVVELFEFKLECAKRLHVYRSNLRYELAYLRSAPQHAQIHGGDKTVGYAERHLFHVVSDRLIS